MSRIYVVMGRRDEEARVWWAQCEDIPLVTEAPTFDALVEQILEIAPEIIAPNHGTDQPEILIHVMADRVVTVRLRGGWARRSTGTSRRSLESTAAISCDPAKAAMKSG